VGNRLGDEVLDHAPPTLTHREKLVLLVLAKDANETTRRTWLSVEDPKILKRAGVSRSQMYSVLKALQSKGVLKKVEGGRKHGFAKYELIVLGPPQRPGIPDAEDDSQGPENRDAETSQGPGFRDPEPDLSVRKSGTLSGSQRPENRDVSVPESGTHTPSTSTTSKQAGRQRPSRDAFTAMQPLQEAMTAAGMVASWTMRAEQIGELVDTVNRVGIPAMVEHARRSWRKDNPPTYITALLRGWSGLPTRKAPATPTQAAPEPDWCGQCAQPDYRYIDHGDDRWGPCPTCNPGAAR